MDGLTMQTFLPYPDARESAALLDPKRLPEQRNEALVLLRSNLRMYKPPRYGWLHHSAARMWIGHEGPLAAYGLAVCEAYRARNKKSPETVAGQIEDLSFDIAMQRLDRGEALRGEFPPWLGYEPFHALHRRALVTKNEAWYGPLFPDAEPFRPDELGPDGEFPYLWPDLRPEHYDPLGLAREERRAAEWGRQPKQRKPRR